LFESLMTRALENYWKESMSELPSRFGDFVLSGTTEFPNALTERYTTNLRDSYDSKLEEGVTEQDFRDFWNEHPLVNAFYTEADYFFFFATRAGHQTGTTEADFLHSWLETAKLHAVYGAAEKVGYWGQTEADWPLPTELRSRVAAIALPGSHYDLHTLNHAQGYSSFNAWVRDRIRLGEV
jgi:hypothetical protein